MRSIVGLAIVAALALPGAGTATPTEGCNASDARYAFNTFLSGFNAGKYSALQTMFAAEPDFMWHAVAPPYGRVAERSFNRATLDAYFRARHARREVLKLVKFNFASTQQRDGALLANFNGTLTRKANDLPLERRGFKAALRCGDEYRFIIVSIGTKI
jgi:hypothetical protein